MEMVLIAELSPETNQWVIGSLATMIAGAIFFFFGAIFGWSLWRKAGKETERLTASNKDLVRSYKERNRAFNRLKENLEGVLMDSDGRL